MSDASDMDEEANAFAMELLMPAPFVRKEIAKMKGFDFLDDDAMKKLADKFRVPTSAMAMRLGQLKESGEL